MVEIESISERRCFPRVVIVGDRNSNMCTVCRDSRSLRLRFDLYLSDSEDPELLLPTRTSENQTEAAAEAVTSGSSSAVSSSHIFNSFPLINNIATDRPYLTALLTEDRDLSSDAASSDHRYKKAAVVAKDSKVDVDDENDVDNPYVRNVKMPKIEKKTKK